ncbi:MAG TPA: translocation/assembly module TamB domain-containing protein [Gemmatimonadaceae bacterium]|jgi:translocation and assembly module TamB
MPSALGRLGRVLLGIFTVVLGIVALVGIVVVVLTSTDWGHERVRRLALSQLQRRVHGRVSIGQLSGNLISGLTVHDLAISDSSGEPFLAAQEASARYALGALIGKKIWLTDVRLTRPLVVLDRPPGGKWNYQRIFASDTTQPASTTPGFGSWIRLENVTVVDGDLVVRTPWSPGTKLSPAARDSAVRDALSGRGRAMVVEAPHAYAGAPPFQKLVELRSINATFPMLRLADPSQKSRYAEIASLQMTALPFRPPAAVVTEMRGSFQFDNDSLWWKGIRASMPASHVSGDGSYAFSSGDMMLSVRGAPAALNDLRWLYPRLPSEGGGNLDFALSWRGGVDDYTARNADIALGSARVRGDFGLTLSDTFALHDTNLRFANLDTRLAEQLIAGFKSPRRGSFTGRAVVNGGEHDLHVDGDVAFADATTGTSQLAAVGVIGFEPNGMRANNLRLRMHPMQVELVKGLAGPKFQLPLSGIVTGTAVVSGDTKSQLAGNVDIAHEDRGNYSQLTGTAAVRLPTGGAAPWLDVNVVARPVSLAEVGRFVPSVGLQGRAVGPIRLTGSLSNLAVASDLRLPDGGQLSARGTVGLTGAQHYDLALGLKIFNLRTVLANGPVTSLTMTASARGAGFKPATMNATFAADLATSKWDSLAVDSGSVRIAIASGVATVQKLNLSGANTLVSANGSFGLVATRTGTLNYHIAVDSLGALDRVLPHTAPDTGSIRPRPAAIARAVRRGRADSARIARRTEIERLATGRAMPRLVVDTPKATPITLKGKLFAAGTLSGNITNFDTRGKLGAADINVHGNAARMLIGEYAWTNARTSASTIALAVRGDSISATGFQFDSLAANLSYHAQNGGGRVEVLVRQGDQRDYGLKGDYVVNSNLRELRLADMQLRFDTTTWQSTHPATIESRAAGISVQNLELRSGSTSRIYANGLLPSNGSANFEVAIDNFPVGDLLDILQSDVDLKGLVSLHGTMQGTLASPRMRGALGVVHGVYKGDTVPDLRGTFGYANRSFSGQLDLLHRARTPMATVTANLPLNLALSGTTSPRLLRQPLAVDLTADSLPLELIPAFTGVVSEVHGVAAGQIAMRGTFDRPSLTGTFRLKKGIVRVASTGMYVDNLTAALSMANDTVRVDTLTGRTGRGTIAVTGGLAVGDWRDPAFNLALEAHNAEVLNNDRGRLNADANMRFTGPLNRPYLNGRVQVTSGVMEFATDNRSVISAGDPDLFNVADTALIADKQLFPAQSPILQNMRIDVAVGINHNTWVRTTDANVEIYTDYPVEVHVSHSALALTGAVGTDRGDYTFLSKRFTITRGSATFVGTPDLNPTLQATGEYQVQLTNAPALNIQVLIGGTLKAPKVTLQSDAQPPKTQSELLTLLAFGGPTTNLLEPEGSSLGGAGQPGGVVGQSAQVAMTRLEGVALGVLFEQLQSRAGKALGADQFYISPGDTPELQTGQQGWSNFIKSTRVEAGKYINPNTFVSVQLYNNYPGVRLEYRASKGWLYSAYTAPQALLLEPTLEAQNSYSKQAYGALIIRQWRF